MPSAEERPAGSRRRRLPLLLAALGLACVIGVVAVLPDEGFERWADGSVHGPWRSVYDGHGRNGERGGVISARPQPATRPDETHAGLVVSTRHYRDVDLTVHARTVAQLRTPKPNPWEAAWVVWNYTDDAHFYYLTLKPNGWELGKRDPAYPGGQRFLATGDGPRLELERWYEVRVEQRGATMSVNVDGARLTTFTDTERPYETGAVGLYTEDAEVEFRDVTAG